MQWLRLQSASGSIDAERFMQFARRRPSYYQLRDPPQFTVTLSDDTTVPFYALSFSLPAASMIADVVPTSAKRRALSSLLPGNVTTYTFDTEAAYRAQYAASYFAYTWRKGGYDCLRHLEIMATGALPVFRRVVAVPRATMAHYPRALFEMIELSAAALLGPLPAAPLAPSRRALDDAYDALSPPALAFLRARLTTRAMACYVLRVMNLSLFDAPVPRVLIINMRRVPLDYGEATLTHGFIELANARRVRLAYGPKRSDFLFHNLLNATAAHRYYGHCYSVCRTLAFAKHAHLSHFANEPPLSAAAPYDLVLYAASHRGPLFFIDQVAATHDRSRVAFFEAEDVPPSAATLKRLSALGTVFAREMHGLGEEVEVIGKRALENK